MHSPLEGQGRFVIERSAIGVIDSRVSRQSECELALSLSSCSRRAERMLQFQHDGQIGHVRHAQFARRATLSQACALVPSGKSAALIPPSRAHHEGRFAIVTNVARDAMALSHQLTSDAAAAAKACGPDPPMLGSSCRVMIPMATVARRARHTEESTP